MENKIYLIWGIIINNVSWAFVCNGYYRQKMACGFRDGFPFVWDYTLAYYIAIIPAIVGIVFIIHAFNNKNKKSLQKCHQSFDKKTKKDVKLRKGERNGISKQNRQINQRTKQAQSKEAKD